MPEEYKQNYMKRYFKMHRLFYVILFGVVLLCYLHKLTPGVINLVYYIPVLIGCFLLDELYLRKQSEIRAGYQSLRILTEILLLSLGNLFGPPHPIEFTAILFFELLLVFEDMLLYDIFDEYHVFIRRVLYLSLIVLGMVACFRNELSGVWFAIGIMLGIMFVGFCIAFFHSFTNGIRTYEKKATDLYFEYVNLGEERDKLKVYQDRVQAVNNEINMQKMELVKVNQNLEMMNQDVRSLIAVMKDFTSSFDVPKNARRMLENIMEMKTPSIAGIYINRNVFMNDRVFMDVLSKHQELQSALARDFYSIYEKLRIRGGTEPLLIAEEGSFHEAALSDTELINVVAFPAYENDVFYGVLVIGSVSFSFFEHGYSFYESSVMDFTAAVRSAKLYLQMKDMAVRDGLTGVYNRAYFNEIYPQICAKSIVDEKSLAVALLDIDKFKSINDTYGHLAGDDVIKMVATVDQHYARKYNGYAVRYGGEEFLLIIPGVTVAEFRSILQEVHDEIVRTVVEYQDERIHVNTSIGMSHYPEIAGEVVDVLNQSDQAMYFSKEHGRGKIVIYGREEECLSDHEEQTA